MKYSMYVFKTRNEAREWLVIEGFKVVPDNTTPGLWTNGTLIVQAFQNCLDMWSVNVYKFPDRANYICE